MDLRERRHGLSRVGLAADLERDRERALQIVDRLVGLAEQVVETAEIVQQATDVLAVAMRLVELFRTLGERPGAKPLAVPLRDDRGLEGHVRDRQRVVEAIGELECALDVLTRSFEVSLPAGATRAPFEDVRAEPVTRQLRAVGEM